ncbi:AAA family ATPase [Candidatus Saccharibacteria bacterium]|nr:AAA family ATPase [Candidatus Saccharibacteria bacterium]
MEHEEIAKIREYVKKQREDHRKLNEWLNSVFEPNVKTIVGWINEFRPDFRDCEKEMENLILRLKSLNSFYEKIESINSQIGTQCDWSKNYLNLLHRTITRYSFAFLAEYFCNEKSISTAMNNDGWRRDVVNIILQLRDRSLEINIREIDNAFAHLENFTLFKQLNSNFIIIGANGSGKSSFSRRTREVLGGNVVIIASQKIFSFRTIESLSLGDKYRQELWNYQVQDKLYKGESHNNQMGEDLITVVRALFEEKNELANKFYDGETPERKESTLDRVVNLWNELLIHRKMIAKSGNIQVQEENGPLYSFNFLSDGEKAIFYYIAHILLAKENSYIIVDEPENHLHLALVTKLWDALELARPDCQFVYLTHNLEFAASRNNVKKIWMKKFIAPDRWEMEYLPTDKDLPEILYMELLGSRKPILFCEGKKDSLDYKLYTRLFPNYTVIPVEGHLQVISYTRAFNNSYNVHHNRAIGIIDGDFHKQEQKDAWKESSVYSLDVQEIENILCDEDVLNRAVDYFHADQGTFEKAKAKLFTEIQRHIDNQCNEYAMQLINNRFKENMLKNSRDLNFLKNSVKELADEMLKNVDAFVEERKVCLQKVIDAKDYAEGIKRFNNKGLLAILSTDIEKDYKNRVFKMLDKNPDLLETLRSKYFADIPQNL